MSGNSTEPSLNRLTLGLTLLIVMYSVAGMQKSNMTSDIVLICYLLLFDRIRIRKTKRSSVCLSKSAIQYHK